MELTKKVELHYGQVQLKGANPNIANHNIQADLDEEREFCAIYVENDVPADTHYETSAKLMKMLGTESKVAQEKGSCVRPFYVVERDGEEVVVMKIGPMKVEKPKRPVPGGMDSLDARTTYRNIVLGKMKMELVDKEWKEQKGGNTFDELNTFRAKGLFFNKEMAAAVIGELEKMGYEVNTKYSPR